jgi:hypothetical protein
VRDPVPTWLLCFIPFVSFFWFHRANKELEAWSGGRIAYNPTSSLLAITIGVYAFLVPPFIAWGSFMGRIREAQRMAGLPETATMGGSLGRYLLLGYNIKWHQEQFNEIAVRSPQY